MHYLSDGRLLIDTNSTENLIRPVAVGRRNYLFAGSHEGAQTAAIFYSLLACCKLNGVDPVEWLEDVMIRLQNIRSTELRNFRRIFGKKLRIAR
jgi:hypothetical protein